MARRFATSTPAVSLSMQLIAGEGLTFKQARERYPHLPEECELLDTFIEHGHGDRPMTDFIEGVQP